MEPTDSVAQVIDQAGETAEKPNVEDSSKPVADDKKKDGIHNGSKTETTNGSEDSKKRPPPSPQQQKQPSKKVKRKHMDPRILATRKRIQMCCASNDLATALDAYREALQKQVRVEPQSFYNLLNLCDGLDRSRVHIGTPKRNFGEETTSNAEDGNAKEEAKVEVGVDTKEKESQSTESNTTTSGRIREVDLPTRKQAAFEIKEQMGKQSIPLNETAYSALVKILSRAKEVKLADEILQEAEKVSQCKVKLRLYSSLLLAYCEMDQLLPALELWERLSNQKLVLMEKEYAALIDCCARVGAMGVMQKVFTDLSEDVLVPAKETCQAIVRWFECSNATTTHTEQKEETAPEDDNIALALSRVPLPANQTIAAETIGSVQSSSKWTISPGCKINTETGTLLDGCLKGETLRPVQLSPEAWQEMLEMNEKIVMTGKLDQDRSQFQGGRKGRKRQLGEKEMEQRRRSWMDFSEYLKKETQFRKDNNHTTTFDVVMDGANIGYFQKNFMGAPKHVDYDQIDMVVQHFLNQKKRVLLVMHQRHFAPKLMPRRFRPLIQAWEKTGVLCKSPAGMNDDWFWMQAALVSGPGTLMVTNDEMRDHFFQMLAPRSFLRWKERHQVHFHFGGDKTNSNVGQAGKLVLEYPEIYSRRIQLVAGGYVIPHPKHGDENRFLDGSHTADEDVTEEETYLCIRQSLHV